MFLRIDTILRKLRVTAKLRSRQSRSYHDGQVVCKEKVKLLEPCCRVAAVTGGTEGIGLAVAYQLLCKNAEHVVLLSTDAEKGLEAVNSLNCAHGRNKATFVKCDVSCKENVDETFCKIKSDFEKLEIFVHCAGIWNEQDWEKQLQTNLKGTIYVNKAIRKNFDSGSGVVVNVAAVQGLSPFAISPVFAAEHAAIVRFTQSWGDEANYMKTGLRTVALCTGITCTDYTKDLEERMPHESKKHIREYLQKATVQKADVCGKSVIELIKFASPGSVWLIEGSRLFSLKFPDWRKSTTLVSQFS